MKQFKFFLILLFAFFISSCNKEDDQPIGVGDVLIVAKKSETGTVYGLSFYTYTFSAFKSVKAVSTAAPEKTYTLISNQGYKTNFYYETPDAEYTTTRPTATTFNFSATFENGATHEFQDVLSDKVLGLPVIEKCEYSATKHMLDVSWAALTGADSYAVTIMDGTTMVFSSLELANTVKTYSVSANGGGWLAGFTPLSGKTYNVKVLVFLYEPAASLVKGPYANSYDVQATSVSEKTVTWGD